MFSRPLRIAFTALTLSLVVSLSLWVLHASFEQRQFAHAVTLQMPSIPAEINSHEVQKNLRSSTSDADPFAPADSEPQMVELEQPPELIGIEAAPVSRSSSKTQSPPPFPSSDNIPGSPSKSPQTVDKLLELPELEIVEPADEGSVVLPELDPAGPEPETTTQLPEPPLVELMPEPLAAPRPPAWLSAQATLEAEIEDLRQQQQTLEVALSDRRSTDEDWKEKERDWRQQQQAWNDEKKGLTEQLILAQKEVAETRKQLAESDRQIAATRKLLESSKQEATGFQQQSRQLDALLKESDTTNAELKKTLKEKLSAISRLENDARKTKHEIEQLRNQRRAVREVPQDYIPQNETSIESIKPSDNTARALLPPLPDQNNNIVDSDVVQEQPIVPRLPGWADPPVETEKLQDFHSNHSRTPLIAAEVPQNENGYCSRCSSLEQPPKTKGLIYDLADWFDEWHIGRNGCSLCKPICEDTGQCPQTVECPDEAAGLIPDLIGWWKHRREGRDCGCR